MGLCDLCRIGLWLIFDMTKRAENESIISDNIKGDRKGSNQTAQDCQSPSLVVT